MLEQLKKRRMVVVVEGLFCFVGAAGCESGWKAKSVHTAKIFVVLPERPDIPTVRYTVSVLVKSVLQGLSFSVEARV